jgi:hypothetical protein
MICLTLDGLFLFQSLFTRYFHYASTTSFSQAYYLHLFPIHVEIYGQIDVGLAEVDLEDPLMK